MDIPSPDKVVKVVTIILPGFLTLGLFSYLSDLYFPEYVFTYLALALSVGVYLLGEFVLAGSNRLIHKWRPNFSVGVKAYVLIVAAISITAAGLLTFLHNRETLLWPLGKITNKVSHENPLSYILRRNLIREDICKLDLRPTAWWTEKQCFPIAQGGYAPNKGRDSYYAFVRVYLKNGQTYEGDPRYWEIKESKFQLALVRACAITERDGVEDKIRVIDGPAVILFSDQISHIEFVEELRSPCRRILNSRNS